LAGASDPEVLAAAHAEGRVLLTLDKGIASLRDYSPESLSGIVLFRPEAYGRGIVLRFVRERLADILALEGVGQVYDVYDLPSSALKD
jgi:hypothetical protein